VGWLWVAAHPDACSVGISLPVVSGAALPTGSSATAGTQSVHLQLELRRHSDALA